MDDSETQTIIFCVKPADIADRGYGAPSGTLLKYRRGGKEFTFVSRQAEDGQTYPIQIDEQWVANRRDASGWPVISVHSPFEALEVGVNSPVGTMIELSQDGVLHVFQVHSGRDSNWPIWIASQLMPPIGCS